jgi:hypothetical protein
MKDKWVKRWDAPGSNGKIWRVAVDKDGKYGCSCPRWKFKREECHHILAIKQNQGKEIKNLTEEERAELKLKAYAEKGFRYFTWYREPLASWNHRELEKLKQNPDIKGIRTFRYNEVKVVVIKETETVYQKEFDKFIELLKKCNLRKKLVKNPFYSKMFGRDSYWIKQNKLQQLLKKKWFDITQHIIYNSSAVVNPNLSKGSTYSNGDWGKKIKEVEKKYRFLKC